MFPPSIHPSGESVEWVEDGEPAKVDGKDLKRAVAELAVATLMARHWPAKGKRNDATLTLAGVLARTPGWTVRKSRRSSRRSLASRATTNGRSGAARPSPPRNV